MDKDVGAKMDKLCRQYVDAAAQVNLIRPTRLPTGRAVSRLQGQLTDVLGRLVEARKAPSAALVRLAYVRGLRASQPQARLGPEHEQDVAQLENRLDRKLGLIESMVLPDFRRYVRRLRLKETSRPLSSLPDLSPYPLEQHARMTIRNVIAATATAGTIAGASSASYADADEMPQGT